MTIDDVAGANMGASPGVEELMDARRMAVLSVTLLCFLAGCGTGSQTTTSQPVAVSLNSGNWAFFPPNPLSGGSISLPPFLSGSLMSSAGQVSGDFLVSPVFDACPLISSIDLALTGTVKGSQLTLTSASWNSGVFTVTGTVAPDGNSISGQWSVKGGCADGANGGLNASYVPPVTGTWTGVLAPLPGQSANALTGSAATVQLVQAPEPTQFSFPLSGTIAISGSSCGFSSGTLMQLPGGDPLAPSSITGYTWSAEAQMNDGKSLVIAVGDLSQSTTGTWMMALGVSGGGCDGAFAMATLARQ